MTKSRVNQRIALPFPIKGLDFRLPLFNMPLENSPFMLNFLTDNAKGEYRPPHTLVIEGPDGGGPGNEIGVIAVTISGTEYIISVQGTTTTDGSGTSATPATLAPPYFDYTIFRDTLFVAGEAVVSSLNPSTLVWANTFTFTGITNPPYPITSYRERVYVGSGTNLYYGGVGAVTGAMTAFSIQGVINGNLKGLARLTISAAFSPEYYLVGLSSGGDLAIWSGSFPGGTDWTLVGKFQIPLKAGNTNDPIELVETPNDVIVNVFNSPQLFSVRQILATGLVNESSDCAAPLRPFFEVGSSVYKRCVYNLGNNSLFLFALSADNPTLATYFAAGYLPDQSFASNGEIILFRIDLDDGAITMHSIPDYMPFCRPRSTGEFVYVAQTGALNVAAIVKCFDTTAASYQDYNAVDGTEIDYYGICKFPPLPAPYRQRKLNNLVMYSNLLATHTFAYQCTSNFNPNDVTFYPFVGDGTTNEIRETVLDGTSLANTTIVGIIQNATVDDAFEVHGIDALYEEGGEF